ncbi:hypothetical protein WA1_33950 [Scytonema hofmannii PCC 7110]|uniref:Uncharacterized protein n=1 Tax=Scytonema hofmannii PCC 7110 TaxID=128403 RepID=A0A139X2S0_9CYAN|nr:hypothetical protein WA1_33950 [Scytonema hofmannii PCC 7110]
MPHFSTINLGTCGFCAGASVELLGVQAAIAKLSPTPRAFWLNCQWVHYPAVAVNRNPNPIAWFRHSFLEPL